MLDGDLTTTLQCTHIINTCPVPSGQHGGSRTHIHNTQAHADMKCRMNAWSHPATCISPVPGGQQMARVHTNTSIQAHTHTHMHAYTQGK